MSDKTAVAIQSMKSAQTEMVQWENRIEAAKQEYTGLKRQSEILQNEIDNKRTEYTNYIAIREKELRDGLDKLTQDRKVLEGQREEFKGALDMHLKDKANLGQEKMDFEKEKSKVSGQRQLVNDFIQAVRRAYNVLPD